MILARREWTRVALAFGGVRTHGIKGMQPADFATTATSPLITSAVTQGRIWQGQRRAA